MKRIFWMVVVVTFALPLAAFADSVDFGGTLSGNSSTGLSLTGSMLPQANNVSRDGVLQSLGSVSFSTGSLTSGTLDNGGTFAAGGKFVVSGADHDGVIFGGSFNGPVTWTMVTLANGTHQYTLTGSVSGTWNSTGKSVFGATVQLTINTGKGFFDSSAQIASGDATITTAAVPEPGTLGLLGTGLVGLAGALHRKFKAPRS